MTRRAGVTALCVLLVAMLLSACGVTRGDDTRDLQMLIPNSPGGGYDQTGLQAFDLFLLLVFGLVGFTIRRFGVPVLPLILGVILGPLMETKMREALDVSGGDVSGLFNETLSLVIYAIIVIVLVLPLVLRRVRGPGDRGGGPDLREKEVATS